MPVRGGHALVIGGSVSGSPTAKVASDYFERVTVIDRDELPPDVTSHRGVPQSPHLHGLLYGGRLALDEIFDDRFTEAMRAAGAPFFDFAQHQAIRFPEGWIRRAPGDLMVVFATRWTTERVIRELARAVPNINFEVGQVCGFTSSGGRGRITGVELRDGRTIDADLVIDAGGRGSKSPQWIEALGYAPPEVSWVRSFLGYSTLYGELPADAWPGDIKSVVAPPTSDNTRGGFVVPQENGLVGVMAAGQSRDYPPGDATSFRDFLATAISPLIGELFDRLEPATEIRTTKTSHNRLVRWHELERRPEGFLAIGDAVAAFNPVYGQGITSAALQVRKLCHHFDTRDSIEAVVADFPTVAMATCEFAWTAAIDADLSFAATETENDHHSKPPADVVAYLSKMRLATTLDSHVAQAFFRAQGTMQGDILFAPEIVERVDRAVAEHGDERRDLARPPAWSDADAPLAA